MSLGGKESLQSEPIDWLFALLDEVCIGLAEGFGAKKTAMRSEGRRVSGSQNQVSLLIDKSSFLLRISTPEDKCDVILLRSQAVDNGIGKQLPTPILMGARLLRLNGKRGV